MMDDKLKIAFPAQGWKQFLSARKEMLDAYDRARDKAKSHEIETYHGSVAEAEFRNWLSGFLPKRYGVTSGYIISQGLSPDIKVPHFDVIIYDLLNAPILWIEADHDKSTAGRSLAIPAEYVFAVLEVKASLNSQSMTRAIDHLKDLSQLLSDVDESAKRYKLYLPPTFFSQVVFFEIRKEHEYSEAAIGNMLGGLGLRGFCGGIVLRGEDIPKPVTGLIKILRSETQIQSDIDKSKQSLLQRGAMSGSVRVTDDVHFSTMLLWMEHHFSQFAFDLVGMLRGTYEPGRLTSFHGMG